MTDTSHHDSSPQPADAIPPRPDAGELRTTFFPGWANYLLPAIVVLVVGMGVVAPNVVGYGFSTTATDVGYRPTQPIPYSHEIHVNQLGMDCLYCHNTVDQAAHAAIPTTQVCITCHNPGDGAGIHKQSAKLKPLFDSLASGEPVQWVKVHDLPDYAYFNHSAHVNKGVSCVSCHGRVDKMGEEGVWQVEKLSMGWCLECHRAPEKHLVPLDQITNLDYRETELREMAIAEFGGITEAEIQRNIDKMQLRQGRELKEKYNIHDAAYMQACSTCHR